MPSKSKKQARLMQAVTHGLTGSGIPKRVAQEYVAADKRKRSRWRKA